MSTLILKAAVSLQPSSVLSQLHDRSTSDGQSPFIMSNYRNHGNEGVPMPPSQQWIPSPAALGNQMNGGYLMPSQYPIAFSASPVQYFPYSSLPSTSSTQPFGSHYQPNHPHWQDPNRIASQVGAQLQSHNSTLPSSTMYSNTSHSMPSQYPIASSTSSVRSPHFSSVPPTHSTQPFGSHYQPHYTHWQNPNRISSAGGVQLQSHSTPSQYPIASSTSSMLYPHYLSVPPTHSTQPFGSHCRPNHPHWQDPNRVAPQGGVQLQSHSSMLPYKTMYANTSPVPVAFQPAQSPQQLQQWPLPYFPSTGTYWTSNALPYRNPYTLEPEAKRRKFENHIITIPSEVLINLNRQITEMIRQNTEMIRQKTEMEDEITEMIRQNTEMRDKEEKNWIAIEAMLAQVDDEDSIEDDLENDERRDLWGSSRIVAG